MICRLKCADCVYDMWLVDGYFVMADENVQHYITNISIKCIYISISKNN